MEDVLTSSRPCVRGTGPDTPVLAHGIGTSLADHSLEAP